jgi:hypothetical protein
MIGIKKGKGEMDTGERGERQERVREREKR